MSAEAAVDVVALALCGAPNGDKCSSHRSDAAEALAALAAAGWSVVKLTPGARLHAYGCGLSLDEKQTSEACTCGRPHFHQVAHGEAIPAWNVTP